jgi:hypothetical protein
LTNQCFTPTAPLTCTQCGAAGEPCCPGNTCAPGHTCAARVAGMPRMCR